MERSEKIRPGEVLLPYHFFLNANSGCALPALRVVGIGSTLPDCIATAEQSLTTS